MYVFSGDTLCLFSSDTFMKCERYNFIPQITTYIVNINFGRAGIWKNFKGLLNGHLGSPQSKFQISKEQAHERSKSAQ
jgi:hypothetical protein